MSVIEKLFGYTKDLILVTERLENLSRTVGDLSRRVEEQERRLIRIEALIELSMKMRLPSLGSEVDTVNSASGSEHAMLVPPKSNK